MLEVDIVGIGKLMMRINYNLGRYESFRAKYSEGFLYYRGNTDYMIK